MTKANEILEAYARTEDSKEAYLVARELAVEECLGRMSCATGGEVYWFEDGSEIRIDKDIIYVI